LNENSCPFISVIVPTKNNEKQVVNCIKSLLAQDYPSDCYEIIISDGHSDDKTASIARQFDVLVLEDDGGCRASGCNKGFEHSKGELIAFTDVDCVVDKHWLRNVVKYFEQETVAGVGGPNLPPKEAPNLTHAVHHVSLLSPSAIDFSAVHEVRTIAGCNSIYRKKLVKEFFPLPETSAAEDTLLNYRLTKAGHRLLSAPDVMVWHDRHYKTIKSLLKQLILYGKGAAQIEREAKGFVHPFQKFAGIFLPILAILGVITLLIDVVFFLLLIGASVLVFSFVFFKVLSRTSSLQVALLSPVVLILSLVGFSFGYLKENYRRN
jgi:cellulose synthase/poly-beta-1,6-N-acetylglucosamine synthase-like glycosyltransferase